MATRNIILLSDGTGNSSGKLFKTNVWRMYQALNLTSANQIAYYDDGVGTSSLKPLALLGGAFGFGLKRNILGLYMFLCRNYRSGDRIHGFGFSRGAFTIRVLVNFVLSMGLVSDFDSTDDLKRKSRALYRQFPKKQSKLFRQSAWALLKSPAALRTAAIESAEKRLHHNELSAPPSSFLRECERAKHALDTEPSKRAIGAEPHAAIRDRLQPQSVPAPWRSSRADRTAP